MGKNIEVKMSERIMINEDGIHCGLECSRLDCHPGYKNGSCFWGPTHDGREEILDTDEFNPNEGGDVELRYRRSNECLSAEVVVEEK